MAYETEAGIIREAQERYRRGEAEALADIYKAAAAIARGMIARQQATRGFRLTDELAWEKARDAASCVAAQYLKRSDFMMRKPQSYIWTWVLQALYDKRKADRIVQYLPQDAIEAMSGEET